MSNRLTRGLALVGALSSDSNIIINVMGTTPLDAATKAYVDATAQGLNVKGSVVAASVTSGNLTLSGTQTVDGVALVAGNRILVKNQTTASQNGIYVVASSTWARAADQATPAIGDYTFVEGGTVNGHQGWMATTTTTWTQFSAAGEYTAGAGIAISGAAIAVDATAVIASSGNDTSAGATCTAPSVSSGVAFTPSATTNSQVSFQLSGTAGSYILTYGPSTGAEHSIGNAVADVTGEGSLINFMVPKGWKVVLTLTTVTLTSTLVTTF